MDPLLDLTSQGDHADAKLLYRPFLHEQNFCILELEQNLLGELSVFTSLQKLQWYICYLAALF